MKTMIDVNFHVSVPPNKALQLTANPPRGLSAAEFSG